MSKHVRPAEVFPGTGEMATLMRQTDWAATALGPVESWSHSLKTSVRILLTSKFDMWLGWGKDVAFLYNDAYRPTLGTKHPRSLATPTKQLWAEIWTDIEPLIRQVYEKGEATWSEALPLLLERNGFPEETYHTFSYSPVFDDDGSVGGLLCAVVEETKRVIDRRRLESLGKLAAQLTAAESPLDVFGAAHEVMQGNPQDIPFSLTYLFDNGRATLIDSTGFDAVHEDIPNDIALGRSGSWSLDQDGALLDMRGFAGLPTGSWSRPPERAVVVKLQRQGTEVAHGAIVVGLNPHLLADDDYLEYLKLLGGQIASGLGSAEAYDATRRRAAALADAVALREEAEQALRRANQMLSTEVIARTRERDSLRDMFQRAPGFMAVLSGPDHLFVSINEAYQQLVGHRDVIGRTVAEALPELSSQGFLQLLNEVYRTGQPYVARKLRANFQRGPGDELEPRYVNLVYQPIHDEDGRISGIFVEGHDITDQVHGEEALRELNADLERQVIERTQARGRTWQVSPDLLGAMNPYGFFVTSNPAWLTVLGWTEEEVASRSFFDMLHPDDVEPSRESFRLTQQGQPTIRFPNRFRCKDGSYRWISWTGVPEDGIVYCSGRDITEEITAQEERDRLWTLSEDLLARADYAGNLLAVNPAWTKVLGWSAEKLLTNPYADIIHADNIETTTAALEEMGRTGQPTRFENLILSSAGIWTPIGWTVSPEPGDEFFIAVGRDLTEDKARERELLEAQEALRQSQKMEAVGQLTGGIAHDFNNLLAGISGGLEIIERRLSQGRSEGLERFISGAQSSAQRAAALTQRLLAFSRRQTLDPRPTDVNRLVHGMEDLIGRTVGPAVAVEVVGAAGLWPSRVDAGQLESALLNLAINARDAMPQGGRITIETANKWLDERGSRERDLTPGQYISICVTDTGTGISKDIVDRIFDPFFTTKPIGQGTGLGLSMIHGFVRQSGGQIRVYSEVDKGTTMCLYLPRYTGALNDEALVSQGEIAELGAGEVVLVIDDEPTVRMLIVDVLEEAGYIPLEAHDGQSGLKILQSDAKIDLLITDVGLPGGMNGRQVADAARQTRPDLKILFVTGYAENAAVGNGHLEPGMEVITKPFVMTELASKITEIIDGV